MSIVQNTKPPSWAPGSRFGFLLFLTIYSLILIFLIFIGVDTPKNNTIIEQHSQQSLMLKTLFSIFVSFLPILLMGSILGLQLGKLIHNSKIRFWLLTIVSSIVMGFTFGYWIAAVFELSKKLGIAPPGSTDTAIQTFLLYPLFFSLLFLIVNSLLAIALFLGSLLKAQSATPDA